MQKDMLESIDDSALETVSGGHGIIGAIIEARHEIREAIGEHIGQAIDHAHQVAGSVVVAYGEGIERLGNAIKNHGHHG